MSAGKGYEIRLSGTGGQGLGLGGKMLAAALSSDGLHVAQSQSYEPTSRGGMSRSDLVVTHETADYPLATALDYLLILDTRAMSISEGMINDNAVVLVDEELALTAESAGLEKAKESNSESEGEMTPGLADTPYSESVRLGHTLYVIPGDYTVRIQLGKNSDSSSLKVKAPKDYEPRSSQAYKIRGKKL